MSEQQAPGTSQEADLSAAAWELLKLRAAISDLANSEGQLRSQEGQLQVLVASYRGLAQRARESRNGALELHAQQHLATLHPQLATIQAHLAWLQGQKAALTQQQQYLLGKRNSSRLEQAQLFARAMNGAAWSAAPPFRLASSHRPRRVSTRPAFWFSVLVASLVIIIAVISMLHARPSQVTQARAAPPTTMPTPTPTPDPPVYTADGTGPSDSSCRNLISIDCYSPQQAQRAFSLNPLYRQGVDGRGQTIVILGAGLTTTLRADLHHFDQAWGMPDPDFQIIEPHGPPAPYTCGGGEDGLQLENTLDVEWSHAIAPGARIILIIGDNSGGSPQESCGNGSIPDDVAYALDHHLGSIISISYAGSELGDVSETAREHADDLAYYQQADSVFKKAADAGVTVLASAGDTGVTNADDFTKADSYWNRPNIVWPASDPNVLAVGGTSLFTSDASGTYSREFVWNHPGYAATGGGLSAVFPEPDYQKQLSNQSMFQGKRGIPDVSFPAEDFLLYESSWAGTLGEADAHFNHWDLAGGTSLSAPCWAGIMALADQMAQKPLGLIQPALYWLGGESMHDIVDGNNTFGGVQGYQAEPGYDLASGWGSPIASDFVPALIQATLEISPGCKHNPRLCQAQPPPGY